MIRIRVLVLCTLGLALVQPAYAAEPWFAEMPTADVVAARTQGTDAFDTAARQWVAFNNLHEMTVALIGDRYAAGEMTAEERELRDSYNGNRARVLRELQASLPPEEQEFYAGTRFAAWSELRDSYFRDSAFNSGLIEGLFSPAFRTMYDQILREQWLSSRGIGLVPTARPDVVAQLVDAGALPALVVIGFVTPILLKRGRMQLDRKDAFKLFLGNRTYSLVHVTGVASGATKLSSTEVYGSGGGGYVNEYGGGFNPITIRSTTTIHDQFFIRRPDGRVDSIKLSGWDFPVADGHLVSAVWAVRRGADAGNYTVIRDHTTSDASYGSAFLEANLMRASGFGLWLVELLAVIALTFVAGPVVGFLEAFVAAAVGAFLGSVAWHAMIKPRFLSRFRRVGLPRIYTELDRVAAAAPAT